MLIRNVLELVVVVGILSWLSTMQVRYQSHARAEISRYTTSAQEYEAGYHWAEEHPEQDPSHCRGSLNFVEGCFAGSDN